MRWLSPDLFNRMDDDYLFEQIMAITKRNGGDKSLLIDQHFGLTNFRNIRLLASKLGRDSVFVSARIFQSGVDLPDYGWGYYWFSRSPWTPIESLFPTFESSYDGYLVVARFC